MQESKRIVENVNESSIKNFIELNIEKIIADEIKNFTIEISINEDNASNIIINFIQLKNKDNFSNSNKNINESLNEHAEFIKNLLNNYGLNVIDENTVEDYSIHTMVLSVNIKEIKEVIEGSTLKQICSYYYNKVNDNNVSLIKSIKKVSGEHGSSYLITTNKSNTIISSSNINK